MDYDSSIHAKGVGVIAVGGVIWTQLWLPLLAVTLILVAAVVIRLFFRRGKTAIDA